ncbi:MAG: transcriptional repressor [Pseudomonadota bacterium]
MTATTYHRLSDAAATALLQDAGINPTQQRVEIAAILFSQAQHCTADQVLARVNAGPAYVSKATVYNTLHLFAEAGLVRVVVVDPSRTIFDSNTSPHQHAFNIDTGELSDIADGALRVEGLPDLPPGTEIVDIEVIVRVRNRRP